MAHSQGNVVAAEVLDIGANVNVFISSQAAISGHAFDNSLDTYWEPGELEDLDTPDVYGKYPLPPKQGLPFFTFAKNRANKKIRFYNFKDWALNDGWHGLGWKFNNARKPDVYYNYKGSLDTYIQGVDRFYYGSTIPGNRDLLFPTDIHEIYSFCAESRSCALGSEAKSVSWFDVEVNLQGPLYGFDGEHYSHSRQFRSNIQKEWNYWKKLTKEANFNLIK